MFEVFLFFHFIFRCHLLSFDSLKYFEMCRTKLVIVKNDEKFEYIGRFDWYSKILSNVIFHKKNKKVHQTRKKWYVDTFISVVVDRMFRRFVCVQTSDLVSNFICFFLSLFRFPCCHQKINCHQISNIKVAATNSI